MNEDLRQRIIAYNRQKQEKQAAYDDIIRLAEPLSRLINALPSVLKKMLPDDIEEIIEKYKTK